ncbi:MAG TPA: alkaline phosphatase family protein [Gemmatimonadaceae bacterium]|nr:alkaline phosphatase family protein [Gemmatimonadaceae bacterium]
MSAPSPGRAKPDRTGRLLRWYYRVKYAAFERERRHDGRRGLIVLQIDALAHADLLRALEQGRCPTIERLLGAQGFRMRRWFSGLPSATPYCQAGIFHGENGGIPAFRFYDKIERRVVTCNAPEGVQYIRDRIHAPGALAGGSSYVNLLDGDAATVAFTVATRERTSIARRLGGGRMALVVALHPVRVARMALQSVWEWLREEWDRAAGELAGRVTHAEGIFGFVRILSNVIVRELQTMAIVLDVYLGVPVIYSTYMQYDELAHHFGPSSRQALGDLTRTDARIAEIWRMVRRTPSRDYDLVILSDHGMTPAVSYRVRFGESLGTTVARLLAAGPRRGGTPTPTVLTSFAESSEYGGMGALVVDTVAQASHRQPSLHRALERVRDWMRSRYGLREIVLPEKYHVNRAQDVVVTYSSCLALVYFADTPAQLGVEEIARVPRRAHLYAELLAHPGIGLVGTRNGSQVFLESRLGRARIVGDALQVESGDNPLAPYGTEPYVVRAVRDLILQPNAGDLVLFGAYDGREIVSFDDQVGAHGSAGGDQMYPFLITPPTLDVAGERLEDARDIHRAIMRRYARPAEPSPKE